MRMPPLFFSFFILLYCICCIEFIGFFVIAPLHRQKDYELPYTLLLRPYLFYLLDCTFHGYLWYNHNPQRNSIRPFQVHTLLNTLTHRMQLVRYDIFCSWTLFLSRCLLWIAQS